MESEKIYRLENASITKALRVTFVQGEGTQENPCRLMWRFYLPDGRYIGEISADGEWGSAQWCKTFATLDS